jgi:hypothetical protein
MGGNKMKRKIIAVILAMAFLICAVPLAATAETAPQSGYTASNASIDIYSPFSNVLALNLQTWSKASQWAVAELEKADGMGLIPDILKGADLTKPITREEFCELALLLYEKGTSKTPSPVSPNPFTDTKNQQVLKAFALGITTGTSQTTFSPRVSINREQCAAMLFRTIKAIAPGGNYTIAGIPDFLTRSIFLPSQWREQNSCRNWASSKATRRQLHAEGNNSCSAGHRLWYGHREAAVLMSVRTYDKLDEIKAPAQAANPTEQTQTSHPANQTQPAQPAKPAVSDAFPEKTSPTKDSIIGVWVYIQENTFGTLAGTMAKHYYVFYPDGTFMSGMPDNGLYGFDFQERKDTADASDTIPDYGTYTFKGGKGQLTGNNGAKLEITMDSRYGSLNIGNYKGFMFIPWLDGKRLDGAYTTIVPNLDGVITESAIAMEPESFLYLNPDGTFEDEKGIFRWQGKNYPTMDELFPTGEERDKLVHPSKGTYEIKDFSLILHYEDGITTKHRILLDVIEMTELDYSGNVISPKVIYVRRERARSNLKYFQ